MTITNETILKAAKAAGLDVVEINLSPFDPYLRINLASGDWRTFLALDRDTDNAKIRRGAEIDVEWSTTLNRVEASAWLPDYTAASVGMDYGTDKAKAEREAVILCAAAKWDAMNTQKQSMFESDEEDQGHWAGDDMMGASG